MNLLEVKPNDFVNGQLKRSYQKYLDLQDFVYMVHPNGAIQIFKDKFGYVGKGIYYAE